MGWMHLKVDGRTLSHEALEQIRIMAVRRVGEGEKPSEVIADYGLYRTSIYRWLRAERRGGEAALKARKATGRPPTLTPKEKLRVRKWIDGHDPRRYGFQEALWTRKIVGELIQTKLDVYLGVTAVGRLLHEVDVTPQKPLRRAYERDPEAIERWMREEYPRIKKRAKKRKAQIFFSDEAGVRSDAVLGRSWGVKGETPLVATSGKRQSVNAISAVNEQGAFWYKTYTERLNATRYVELLRTFMRGRKGRVILIVDRHPAHIAKAVSKYVQSLRGRLEVYFLPGYAPELNPDEFVWNHLKNEGVAKRPLRKDESLRERVDRDLKRIKRSPSLVRSFFGAPSVSYLRD